MTRWWTMAELKRARFHAEEGLSLGRTAKLLNRNRSSLAGAAKRHGIRFRADSGAPYDNQNAARVVHQTPEARRAQANKRMRRFRQRLRSSEVFVNGLGWVLPDAAD